MKGDANLSTIKATYFPPSIQPLFMGAHPPVKSGYGSLVDSGNISYFQNYRNENLSKFQMPPYEWGLMSTPYSPKPDLVAADKVKAKVVKDPDPKNITLIDPGQRRRVDSFYEICQMHRNQYKDHSGKLHPLDYFSKTDYAYQCPPEITRNYFKYPTYYTQYKHPHALPKTLERTSRIPDLPGRTLYGRYYKHSDNSYNR